MFILPPPYPHAPTVALNRKSSPSGTWQAILETAVPTVAPRSRSAEMRLQVNAMMKALEGLR